MPTETFEALRADGWRLSRTSSGELRVVCMPHVTRSMLESFVSDLTRIDERVNVRRFIYRDSQDNP